MGAQLKAERGLDLVHHLPVCGFITIMDETMSSCIISKLQNFSTWGFEGVVTSVEKVDPRKNTQP